MAQIQCPECGGITVLDILTYWDIEDTDVKCSQCKTRLTITVQKGQLKKLQTRKPAASEV